MHTEQPTLRNVVRGVAQYRGGVGQWAWVFHRVSGVAVLLFLLIHIVETQLIFRPSWYDWTMRLFKHPLFRVGEVLLAAAVLYHALNGIRIILIDFYPGLTVHHRRLFYGVLAVFVLIFIPGAYFMLKPLF